MISDLESIGNTFKVHYAPVLWKKQHKGWDLNQALQIAHESIHNKQITVKEYQKIIRRFFRSIQDYHCSVRFHSTELSILPFNVVAAKDRYFIVDVNKYCLPSSSSSISDGDEIISINGKAVHDLVVELQREEFGTIAPGTDRALTTTFLTRRFASAGSDVPKGAVNLKLRSAANGRSKSVQLIWHHRPEEIAHHMIPMNFDTQSNWVGMMINPLFFDLREEILDGEKELSKHNLGHREGFLPNLGKVLWATDPNHTFKAYLFELEGNRRVGYIRIPHYMGGATETAAFGDVIRYFEDNSEALVIDQLNNPGGSVFYLYALASMLTEAPLETPKHSITITPREVEFAAETIPAIQGIKNDAQARDVLGKTLGGYPVTLQTAQFLMEFCRFIIKEWNAGKTLTHPTHLYGVDHVNPHPDARYTKPILMLINELDFSGGDFMPAIMQDNKRAILMGERTAGAGGFVAKSSFPNRFGIDYFFYTASIAHRKDQNPIENLGVTPEIPYALTPEDIQMAYKPFIKNILKNLKALID